MSYEKMREIKELEVTDTHLKLLQRFEISWDDCEFGAPSIDCKRPYGNSDVYQDMIEIIGLTEIKDGIYEFKIGDKKWLLKGEDKYNMHLEDEKDLWQALDKIHIEMGAVLQVCMKYLTFEKGKYVYEGYTWKKVSEE